MDRSDKLNTLDSVTSVIAACFSLPKISLIFNFGPSSRFLSEVASDPEAGAKAFKAGLKFRENGNFMVAIQCFKKASKSAGSEGREASNVLGVMYSTGGEGVPRDRKKAKGFFLKAACLPPPKDEEMSWEQWEYDYRAGWEKAKRDWEKNKSSVASVAGMFNLALLYEEETEECLKGEALPLFKLAANAGYIPAQLRLVNIYEGESANLQEFNFWSQHTLRTCRKASELGDKEAQFWLARIHEGGLCRIPKDQAEAKHWYEKAACQSYAPAQFFLGLLYQVKEDFKEARFWFKKAADQGISEAQYNLGVLYYEGNGVAK